MASIGYFHLLTKAEIWQRVKGTGKPLERCRFEDTAIAWSMADVNLRLYSGMNTVSVNGGSFERSTGERSSPTDKWDLMRKQNNRIRRFRERVRVYRGNRAYHIFMLFKSCSEPDKRRRNGCPDWLEKSVL